MRTLVCLLAVLVTNAVAEDMVEIKVDKELEIKDFLDQISMATGKPLLYDPKSQRIRGQKMGAGFSHTVPKHRAFDTFRAILAFYELSLVPIGPKGYEVYLVVDSRSTNNFIKNKAQYVAFKDLEKYADHDGYYISCAVPVKNIKNLTTLRTALSTMVSPAGIGRVHEVPGSQSIIIVDFAPTVAAMAHLIKQMDVRPDGSQPVLEVIELKHVMAKELADAINEVLTSEQPKQQPAARGRVSLYVQAKVLARVVPYAPRNALLVTSTRDDLKRIQALVTALDQPPKRLVLAEGR